MHTGTGDIAQKMNNRFPLFYTAGRGETIRLLFHAVGTEFNDNRLAGEQWAASKSDGKLLLTTF